MLRACILLALLSVALAANIREAKPVDNEAIFLFATIGAGRANKSTDGLLAYAEKGLEGWEKFSYEDQIHLLETGGLSGDAIDNALVKLMPKLKQIGRSTQEQAMALLMLAQKFCYRTKDGENACFGDESEHLALAYYKTPIGCLKKDITSIGLDKNTRSYNTSGLDENDMCTCEDQSHPELWMAMMNSFSGKTAAARKGKNQHDQLVAVLETLFDRRCEGYLKENPLIQCSCNRTTEGHDALYMHVMMTNPELTESIISEKHVQNTLKRKLKAEPEARISSDQLMNFLLRSMGSSMDPMMLAFLTRDKNSGVSSSEFIKQLMLSNMGVDASLAHILLSNGLSGDENKVAMINYMTATGNLDPTFVPMMLGVKNGKSFYLSSLVQTGALDPLTGLLLIGRDSGLDNKALMDIILESAINPNKDEYLASIYTPFVPGLPAGIYPGSKLFFAHFELLGVNTCALHDLKNRVDCGYIGITAAECETAPYCCYSPIFLDDETVRQVTGDPFAVASAIPWCYYNIFFVLYDSYHMTVQAAGGFASPITCKGLFKYGLKIDPTLYSLLGSTSLKSYMIAREDCGFPGITEFHCVAIRGCCWDAENTGVVGVPQCYKKNGDSKIEFSFSSIPAAYVPAPGSCNINRKQIRALYYKRTACHYGYKFYQYGYNALSVPNRLDCLTRLGCCYEDDDAVAELYPFVPRCYAREDGAIPGLDPLALVRSGAPAEAASDLMDDIQLIFPKVQKNNTE